MFPLLSLPQCLVSRRRGPLPPPEHCWRGDLVPDISFGMASNFDCLAFLNLDLILAGQILLEFSDLPFRDRKFPKRHSGEIFELPMAVVSKESRAVNPTRIPVASRSGNCRTSCVRSKRKQPFESKIGSTLNAFRSNSDNCRYLLDFLGYRHNHYLGIACDIVEVLASSRVREILVNGFSNISWRRAPKNGIPIRISW
jgi:hypothetical protein